MHSRGCDGPTVGGAVLVLPGIPEFLVCWHAPSGLSSPPTLLDPIGLTSLDYDLSYISILPPNPEIGRDHRLGNLKGALLSAVQHADGRLLRRGAV